MNTRIHLRLHLLGDLELWSDGQIVPPNAWPSRKARQLLGILVTHRHRAVSSEELIEWLWPDLGPESARNSMWVAVSRLRRVLEPELVGRVKSTFILAEPPGYRFDPAGRCEIDVEAFLALVLAGQSCQQEDQWLPAIDAYLAAQALYRGDYLAPRWPKAAEQVPGNPRVSSPGPPAEATINWPAWPGR